MFRAEILGGRLLEGLDVGRRQSIIQLCHWLWETSSSLSVPAELVNITGLLLRFWHQFQCVHFPPYQVILSWVSYSSIEFDTPYLETASDSTVPQTYPLHTLHTPIASPGWHLCFWPTGYRSEIPATLSSVSINLLGQLIDLREIFTVFFRL